MDATLLRMLPPVELLDDVKGLAKPAFTSPLNVRSTAVAPPVPLRATSNTTSTSASSATSATAAALAPHFKATREDVVTKVCIELVYVCVFWCVLARETYPNPT